jgi:protein gp37
VEDQKTADERIPLLMETPAAVRWISAEPLLGLIDLESVPTMEGSIDWVVVGGESGPKARAMHPDWARSLRDQCVSAGVPFFFKQWGEWVSIGHELYGSLPQREMCWIRSDGFPWEVLPEDENADIIGMKRVGKKNAGRLLDGKQWNEYPKAKAVAAA